MKVKIFTVSWTWELEDAINDFIKDKKVIDIKYRRYDDITSALVMYEEKENA